MFPEIRRITRKELSLFFATPIAYLFLATFAAVTLFIFFWVDAFFARNISDVRPLFEWMPILLIFLASALTMRLWSDERRTGTLEHILTQPVPLWHFIAGKWLSCLVLLLLALLITLPLPITVSLISALDWGPVLAGYLATFLLGATYLSMGLFASSRCSNQIVSLICTCVLCGTFYLIGAPIMTDLFSNDAGHWLRLLGTGARFNAITRGVIDFRDLYYYLTLIALFLTLNLYGLERERWAQQAPNSPHRQWRYYLILIIANILAANFWIGQLTPFRWDVTHNQQYTMSAATRHYLRQLQEPLLIRGYFSSKTHPLLAPLVPQLEDLLQEYEVAGHGKVKVEFIDPGKHPRQEKEANEKYGIKPVPFQIADRYQSSIVNSYFNVLIQYGDQSQVLNFQDLIDVRAPSETQLNVQLRNPEHDITSAIKKVLTTYQSGGNLFDLLSGDITFTGYISDDKNLPPQLVQYKNSMMQVLNDLHDQSAGKFHIHWVDPQANGGKNTDQILQQYGLQPMTTNLLSQQNFYFYLMLDQGKKHLQLPLGDMTKTTFRRNLVAALKRFTPGFTKTVTLVSAPGHPTLASYGMETSPYQQLQKMLGDDLTVKIETLESGHVSGDTDVLVVLDTDDLDDKQLFAMDQFLMRGGTVILATSPYHANLENETLSMTPRHDRLMQWLAHNGLNVSQQLVLDPQSSALPLPVTRTINGFQFQEFHMMSYPFFMDIRGDGLNPHQPITADLSQVTLTWPSPITLDTQQYGRTITPLLWSSPKAWLSNNTQITPQLGDHTVQDFKPTGLQKKQLVGVISQGNYQSFFNERTAPDMASDKDSVHSLQTKSPQSARIILFSSSDFLNDQILQLDSAATHSRYTAPLQLLANTIDWSLEDPALLSIRSRSHFNQTLPEMTHTQQLFLEYLNYALAALLLLATGFISHQYRRHRLRRYQSWLEQKQAPAKGDSPCHD